MRLVIPLALLAACAPPSADVAVFEIPTPIMAPDDDAPPDVAALPMLEACGADEAFAEELWSHALSSAQLERVAWSPAGEIAVMDAAGALQLWSVDLSRADRAAELVARIDGGVGPMAWDARGAWLLIGTDRGGLVLRDAVDLASVAALEPGGDAIVAVALDADARTVAGATRAGALTVWTPGSGAHEVVPTRIEQVEALAFLPDGALAVAGTLQGRPAIEVRDATADGLIHRTWLIDHDPGAVRSVHAADGHLVAVGVAGGEGFAAVLDADAVPRDVHLLGGHVPYHVGVLPGGELATVGDDDTVRLFNVGSGAQRLRLVVPVGDVAAREPVTGVVAALDGGALRLYGCRR